MNMVLTVLTWLILLGFCGWAWWKVRKGQRGLGIALLAVTLTAWPFWEWARPHVIHGVITGTEVKRVDHDHNPATQTKDVRFIYAHAERDFQFRNEDSWLWIKVNSDSIFGRAKPPAKESSVGRFPLFSRRALYS